MNVPMVRVGPVERRATEYVDVIAGADGRLHLIVDGETVAEIRFATGVQFTIKVDHLYTYKTTLGRRDQYRGTTKKA